MRSRLCALALSLVGIDTLAGAPSYSLRIPDHIIGTGLGQFHARLAQSSARFSRGGVTFSPAGVTLTFSGSANTIPVGKTISPLPIAHFGPGSSIPELPYSAIVYLDVYPGISASFRLEHGLLKSDFIVQPGGDPSLIRLRFHGARSLRIAHGTLIIETASGVLTQPPPVIYQEGGGLVAGRYVQRGQEIGFAISPYDRTRTLIIDPYIVSYSSLAGGSGIDAATGLALDSAGNAYVCGWTDSFDFPAGAFARRLGVEAFVLKFSPTGSLLWAAYLGGSGEDKANSIAVDSGGSVYVAGSTTSIDFPTAAASQAVSAGSRDGWIAKLNSSGTGLAFSTYLGGAGEDGANGLALAPNGEVGVVGETTSINLPVVSALRGVSGGQQDALVARLSQTGARLSLSYYGGSGNDRATAVAFDSSNAIYFTGESGSTNFPVQSAFQAAKAAGQDAFAAKLAAGAQQILYSTFLGGSGGTPGLGDIGHAISVNPSGSAVIAGATNSTNFPVLNPVQPSSAGSTDAFIAVLNSAGNALLFGTYLGGTGFDEATRLALHTDGSLYIAGSTTSADFPLRDPAQPSHAGLRDLFVAKLDASFTNILFSTVLGGSGSEDAAGVAASGTALYIAGQTASANFIPASTFRGATDIFLTKLTESDLAFSLTSVPSGLQIGVTGASCGLSAYTTPATALWKAGASCTMAVPGQVTASTRIAFDRWADGSTANPRTVTALPNIVGFDVITATSYKLNRAISPAGGGSIDVAGFSGDDFYSSGTSRQLTAVSTSGYVFSSWSGDLAGSQNPATLVMSAPRTAIANFSCSFTLGSALLNTSDAGSQSSVALTTGVGCFWTAAANVPWVSLVSSASNSGTSTVVFSIAANTAASGRTGSLTIAGQQFIVVQSGVPAYQTVFETLPAGLTVATVGAGCNPGTHTATAVFTWPRATVCSLSIASPQSGAAGVRHVFIGWADGPADNPRTISIASALTYRAVFRTEYLLTASANPAGAGLINRTPSPLDGYYASGASVQIQAAPIAGFVFSSWSGDASGSVPATLLMDRARPVTATFVPEPNSIALATWPPGIGITISGDTGCSPGSYTAPAAMRWAAGLTCTAALPSRVPASVDARYFFTGWTDGGANSTRAFTSAPSGTYTALYDTEFATTSAVSPSLAGSVSASTACPENYCATGTVIQYTASPSPGYQFASWLDGGPNPKTVTITSAGVLTAKFSCVYSLSHSSATATASGGAIAVQLTAGSTCAWTTAPGASWLSLTPTGVGSTLLQIAVQAHTAAAARTASVSIAGQSISITQAGVGTSRVNLASLPSGLGFTLSGAGCASGSYATPAAFDWAKNTTCTVSFAPVMQASATTRFVFTGWQDGNLSAARPIPAAQPGSYTAAFRTDHQVSAGASPSGAGAVNIAPQSGDGFYPQGTILQFAATPAAGFQFSNWGGSIGAATFTVTGPATLVANFSAAPVCTFSASPPTIVAGASGLKGTYELRASLPNCDWILQPGSTWVQPFPLSGRGTQTIQYTIFPNFAPRQRSSSLSIGSHTVPIEQGAASGTANERFASLMYFNFLGRLATPAEVAFQASALDHGMTRAAMVANFFAAAEFNAGGRFVAGLYVGLLNRDAEYGGWLFQRNALATNIVDQTAIVAGFLGTPEYQLTFGSPSNAEFVRLLYRYVLLREAAQPEVDFQAGALASGNSRVSMAANFLNSQEFRQGTGPRLTAFLMYSCILLRDASTQEKGALASEIGRGTPLENLFLGFLNSPEFAALLN